MLFGKVGIFFIFLMETLDKIGLYMYNTKLHNYDGAICPLVFFGDALYRVKIRGICSVLSDFYFAVRKYFFDAGTGKKADFLERSD